MSLPKEIINAIAIANAKPVGEQPAILANLALANQILNTNLQQQMEISQQQAINQVTLATMAKAISEITDSSGNPADIQKHIAELEKGLEAEQKALNELIQSNKEISDKIAEVQKES